MVLYRQLTKQTQTRNGESEMNKQLTINKNMILEQKIQTQIKIAATWGQHWTRRQAANHLWFIGWISDHQWQIAAGEA